ncbi:hypothetical protein Tco_0982559 [Tanacetum coccineum]
MAQLKKLTFEKLKVEFEKLMRSIESFVPMGSEERVKRPGVQLEQESSKKQKIVGIEEVPVIKESNAEPVFAKGEGIERPIKKRGKRKKQIARKGIYVDKTTKYETEEEREAHMKDKVTDPSSGSDIGIDAIPTTTKPPSVVDWKIIPQLGQKLYRLVIKKYGANRPEEMYDRVLWGDLKTMLIHLLVMMLSRVSHFSRRWSIRELAKQLISELISEETKDEVLFINSEDDCEARWDMIVWNMMDSQSITSELASPKHNGLVNDFSNPLMDGQFAKIYGKNLPCFITMSWLLPEQRLLVLKSNKPLQAKGLRSIQKGIQQFKIVTGHPKGLMKLMLGALPIISS